MPKPFLMKPMTITLRNVSNARVAVTASWAVAVKARFRPNRFPTFSRIPIMFMTSTSMKMVKTKGM